MPKKLKINPNDDGVTHINIYSKGKTEIGRMLSNFTTMPFEYKGERFNSVEGYWFYLATNENAPRRNELKTLSGYLAKKLGGELIANGHLNGDMVTENDVRPHDSTYWSNQFKQQICEVLEAKLKQHPELQKKLIESTLPFDHYYVFDEKAVSAGYKWLVREWEILRGLSKLKVLD